MKAQSCRFARADNQSQTGLKKDTKWERGIAFVSSEGFSGGSVDFIIDENGNKLVFEQVYDWCLNDGPLCYIDTDYPS